MKTVSADASHFKKELKKKKKKKCVMSLKGPNRQHGGQKSQNIQN